MDNINSHVIICILDAVNKEAFASTDEKQNIIVYDLINKPFEHDNLQVYDVIKAEEPVKYLLYEAKQKQETVEKVIYFCPEECKQNIIPDNFSALNCETSMTSEDYFKNRITEYCQKYHIQIPEFESHNYLSNIPSDSILNLCQIFLNNKGIIDIDITGGRDDASSLLQTLSQVCVFNKNAQIGSVVFCDHNNNEIVHQNSSFKMVSTFNAIDDFLNYGRADKLNNFFNNSKTNNNLAEETQNLSKALSDFSDCLYICDLANIDEKIKDVNNSIKQAKNRFNEVQDERDNFRRVHDEYNKKRESDSFKDIKEAIGYLSIRKVNGLGYCNDFNMLDEEMNKMHKSYNFERNDILLFSMLDVFDEQFVQYFENADNLIIRIIEWCVERDYIVQALILLKEHFSDIMFDFGYINKTAIFENNKNYWVRRHGRQEEITQLRDVLNDTKENCQHALCNSLFSSISKFDKVNWDINNTDDWVCTYKIGLDLCLNEKPHGHPDRNECLRMNDLFELNWEKPNLDIVLDKYDDINKNRNIICHSLDNPYGDNIKKDTIVEKLTDFLNELTS